VVGERRWEWTGARGAVEATPRRYCFVVGNKEVKGHFFNFA
jgi:hypothetical protein